MKPKLIEEISTIVPKLEGWASVEKALAMAELIKEEKPRTIVEIGVFGGRSLIPQAMAIRSNGFGRIHGIDPWQVDPVLEGSPSEADAKWWSEVDLHSIHRGCMEQIWNLKLSDWVVILRSTSTAAVGLFAMIDLLHIDGNHTELASCRDVEQYLPRVKKKGAIWFDDCDWPSTQKALALLDAKCERIKQIGNCILFRKGKTTYNPPYSRNPKPETEAPKSEAEKVQEFDSEFVAK